MTLAVPSLPVRIDVEAAGFVDAVRQLYEAQIATRRERTLAVPAKRVRRTLKAMWRSQAKAIVSHLRTLRTQFAAEEALREAVTPSDWEGRWEQIAANSGAALEATLGAEYPRALASGARVAIADCAVDLSFTVAHPDAVAFLRGRAATRVAGINDTTRDQLRTLLGHAADEGWSWSRTAKEIETTFAGFSRPVPQTFLRTRAELVATTELAQAYEAGQSIVRGDLAAQGLVVEKSWLTVGDDRVSPDCVANAGQGWIGHKASFASGAGEPPSHPGCRCSSLSRVNTEGE